MASTTSSLGRAHASDGHVLQPPHRRHWVPLVLGTGLVVVAIVLVDRVWLAHSVPDEAGRPGDLGARGIEPLAAAVRLLAALGIGLLITVVQRHARGHRLMSRSVEAMEQSQVLLALAGALMMMVIGNSLAHAFGIAGAASIIRFRTPVEDPRDVTVLFLAMALGMSAGLGAFAVAAVGVAFLCAFLVLVREIEESEGRSVKVTLVSNGPGFPLSHVHAVFDANGITIDPIGITAGKEAAMRFRGRFPGEEPLDRQLQRLSEALLAEGTAGLKEVSWDPAKVH